MDLQWSSMKYIFVILSLSSGALGVGAQTSFQRVSDCICSGDIVTYECTVCTGVATVWEGTAFDCDSNGDEVSLTHIDFGTSASFRECNSGRIVGRGLSINNGCYTSQLNVTFEPGLQGRTVVCLMDDGTQTSEVSRDVLSMSTEPFAAPTVSVQEVNQAEISFSWNQTHNCPSLYNDILPSNCGICPNTSTGTSVSCVNFTTSADVKVCEFELQVVICNTQLRGSATTPALVNLTVPRASQVSFLPHYLLDGGLRGLTIRFAEVAPFKINKGINGSIESYTVTYSDADSGALCYSQTIPANDSDCSTSANACIAEFNVSSSICPQLTDFSVSVFVTTNLGDGPKSNPIVVEYQNSYVTVEVIAQTPSINCTFPGMTSRGADYSCNATIIYGPNCQDRTNLIGEVITDNLISIGLRSFLTQTRTSRSCGFVVNVTAGEKFLTVEGNVDFVTLLSSGDNGAAIAAAVTVTVVSATLITIVLVVALILIFRRKIRAVERQYQTKKEVTATYYSDLNKIAPKFHRVEETCNMIQFAKKIHPNYNPDSGTGYFQLQPGSKEYISSTTEVVLINEDKTEMRSGIKARQLLGFCDRRQPIQIPESFEWEYVFIQSTSRIRKLPKGTHFIFYPEAVSNETSESDSGLKTIPRGYYSIYNFYKEMTFGEIFHTYSRINLKGNLDLLTYFYEFTEPEAVPYDTQIILMDKDRKLYYGPGVRRKLQLNPDDYNEADMTEPPQFPEDSKWKRVFLQSMSVHTKLKSNTKALFCTIEFAKSMIRVVQPFEIFHVTEEDEESRYLFKFARKRVPDFHYTAGYSYYEFTKRDFVAPWRNVMALTKSGELYTGSDVYDKIGAPDEYDDIKLLDPPDFSGSDKWDCIFIQATSIERILEHDTRFLYCEYDYDPK